ncbi:MAG: Crp/Fnr family transcriptional regulator [Roseateles asaccharophilus]|uniref:CRP/FNR family transcriptional regulator n=1 Tax=Roseateles asaccharophilus TaxID=582607 RepID=A0A4R6NBV2_9BURK|nr:Crp/Fnr family transcriptional regulator [Roseateles asaccharophilus]MDN3542838.1 Crp/Fnr family transcriptional regulator [Roseateles asaccharophilus]TDP13463.1 CRP/FNR family transcriptional regulator [Roseateles asaccharophilus]
MNPSAPNAAQIDELMARYPAVANLPAALRNTVLTRHALALQVPAGSLLFGEGQPCQGFPMVLRGEVRVARGAPNGRSLELYRVQHGELCVASTSCLFGHAVLAAHGVSTEACELIVLDPQGFALWTADEGFRRYVFGIFAERIAELMALAEAVAFQRLDQRLAGALLGHGAVLQTTHQQLADELGTVREIVTRLLKRFEREAWLSLGRERIEILDPAALRRLASGQA